MKTSDELARDMRARAERLGVMAALYRASGEKPLGNSFKEAQFKLNDAANALDLAASDYAKALTRTFEGRSE